MTDISIFIPITRLNKKKSTKSKGMNISYIPLKYIIYMCNFTFLKQFYNVHVGAFDNLKKKFFISITYMYMFQYQNGINESIKIYKQIIYWYHFTVVLTLNSAFITIDFLGGLERS